MPNEVKHDPQPEEIRRECEKIREGWSATELRKRCVYPTPRVVAAQHAARDIFGEDDLSESR